MRDLLRFEIWQVFLLKNLCDVCLRMHGPFKIAFCSRIAPEVKWQWEREFCYRAF